MMIEFTIPICIFDANKIELFMKKAIFLILIVLGSQTVFSQGDKTSSKIYDSSRNAKNDIALAVKKAKQNGRNVMVQIGGNWCPWCLKIHQFMNADKDILEALSSGYEFVLVNYSKDNKNEDVLASLKDPARFGFPVFVILDSDGNVIHIQDSGYLEEGKSYNKDKVLRFIKLWTVQAVSGKK